VALRGAVVLPPPVHDIGAGENGDEDEDAYSGTKGLVWDEAGEIFQIDFVSGVVETSFTGHHSTVTQLVSTTPTISLFFLTPTKSTNNPSIFRLGAHKTWIYNRQS
jgi:hypothetical protein